MVPPAMEAVHLFGAVWSRGPWRSWAPNSLFLNLQLQGNQDYREHISSKSLYTRSQLRAWQYWYIEPQSTELWFQMHTSPIVERNLSHSGPKHKLNCISFFSLSSKLCFYKGFRHIYLHLMPQSWLKKNAAFQSATQPESSLSTSLRNNTWASTLPLQGCRTLSYY